MTRLQQVSLLRVIGDDMRHYRGLLALAMLALISALMVVYLSHLNRELIVEREDLLQARDALDVEWRHLAIEQTALAEHNRIEQLAVRNLAMQRPDDDQEVLVPWR